MKNIVLLGNGFDLSHDLKTTYGSFLEKTDAKLFDYEETYQSVNSGNICNPEKQIFTKMIKNELYRSIVKSNKELWCDIETEYYTALKQTKDVSKLNEEFDIIKKLLSNYLSSEAQKSSAIECYSNIFSKFRDKPVVVNFNYTNTAEHYKENFKEIIHIHGELNSETNPIVFGYAANREETNDLLSRGNDEYLKNIKQYEYLGASNFNRVLDYLKSASKINVILMGLSCGESDKLILGEIFKHENVKNIFHFYYKNRSSHLRKLMNINRIVGEDIGFDKYKPMPECLPMPQSKSKIREDLVANFFKVTQKYGL